MFGKPDTDAMKKKVGGSVASFAPQRAQKQKKASRWPTLLAGAVAGALGMFFLDPRGGNRRRALLKDKAVSLTNSVGDFVTGTVPQSASVVAGKAQGLQSSVAGAVPGSQSQSHAGDDDKTVTDRVMSEVFRDPTLPKGEVNVNTVDHVVYLRGHVEDPTKVQEIEARTRKVPGVTDVVNLINKPEVDPTVVREQMAQRDESKS